MDSDEIILYQEAFACLEIIVEKIENAEKVDLAVIFGYYERCELIITTLLSKETNDGCKFALDQLLSTFEWHKEMLSLSSHSMACCGEEHVSASGENASAKSELQAQSLPSSSASEKSVIRREAVLGTMVRSRETRLRDVAGLDSAKQTLKEAIILPLRFPHLFSGARKPWTRMLLYGPPGTGKSRLGQAIAGEVNSAFFSVSSADLLSSFFGESEKIIKELFLYAGQLDGCSVIFIDEIDSICRKRTSTEEEHTRRVKTELLKQMDGCNPDLNKVFVLCATNCPWDLDTAFLRRFQRRVYVPLPDRATRLKILQMHTGENEVNFSDANWNVVLDETEGFSGSDLANLATSAMLQPIRELQLTSFWVPTAGGYMRPASGPDQDSLEFHLDQLPSSKVIPREVKLSDFATALQSTCRTVQPDELTKYEEFAGLYGQC